MRNISFMLTTRQFYAQTKTVTRRFGWWNLKVGDVLMACEKCQGLGKGGHPVKIGPIQIVSAAKEAACDIATSPHRYGYEKTEVALEGFPEMKPAEFVTMLCEHNHKLPNDDVNRIEFKYLHAARVEGGK